VISVSLYNNIKGKQQIFYILCIKNLFEGKRQCPDRHIGFFGSAGGGLRLTVHRAFTGSCSFLDQTRDPAPLEK